MTSPTPPPSGPAPQGLTGSAPAAGPAGRVHRGVVIGTWVLLAGLLAAAWGVTTAQVEYSFGPHEAQYEVTTDGTVTVDVGPLGTLQLDAPLPLGLGARVTVQEIPQDVVALDPVDTLEALGGDLEQYVQFFSAPQATLDGVVRALVLDGVQRTLLAWVWLLAVVTGARALLGAARRAELAAELRPHRRMIAAVTAMVLVVGVALTSSSPGDRVTPSVPASAVFAGTALEGARVTGRLSRVIDTYGVLIVEAYEQNDEFYARATTDLARAWAAREVSEEALFSRSGAQDRAGQDDDEQDHIVTLLLVSDLHCNVGMTPVIRRAAELSGAQVILNAGDTTVNGTSVESYCITSFASAVPEDVTMVVSDGNHDSEQTAAQERSAGMTVLDGEPVTIAGVRILGDVDPNATRIGSGTAPVGEESLAQAGERLARVACADGEGVDLLLVHTPRVGDAALEQGCVPVQLSGHMHTRVGPYQVGRGVRYVSASSAGAALNQPTVGPLNAPAEMTVLTFDTERRAVVAYRLLVIQPDGTAMVGFDLGFPRPRAVPGDHDSESDSDVDSARRTDDQTADIR